MPNLEGVARSAWAAAFAHMEGTDIDARNAGAQASARTEKRGMCATLAAARVFAPMAVTGTGAPNAGARVFASTAGAKMLAGIVAPHNFLLLRTRMLWLLPLRMGSRALPLLSHSIWLFHDRAVQRIISRMFLSTHSSLSPSSKYYYGRHTRVHQ
jgi:hypothetical protein